MRVHSKNGGQTTFTYVKQYLILSLSYMTSLRELGWETPEWNRCDEQTKVFKNPILPPQKINEMREDFYNSFFLSNIFSAQIAEKGFL
jgi:hypothetical protein